MSDEATIRARVRARGDTVQRLLRTAGQQALPRAHALPEVAEIWWVHGEQADWFVAVGSERTWMVRGQARLQTGWTQDTVHIGPASAPLRLGTRKVALAMIRDRGSESLTPAMGFSPDEVPAPSPSRALAARAASLPPWWADKVPGPAEARWLMAWKTATPWPVGDGEGQVHTPAIWIGLSDAHAVLAVPYEGGLVAVRPIGPDAPIRARGRALQLGALELKFPRSGPVPEQVAALLQIPPGPARWARCVEDALRADRPDQAVIWLREARELGRQHACDPALARALEAGEQREAATAVLLRSLRTRTPPTPALLDEAARWEEERPALIRALGRTGVLPEALLALADLPPLPDRPEGFPWPPDGPREVWSAALALADRLPEAEAVLLAGPPSARGLALRAALRSSQEQEQAALAWARAALAHPEASDEACEALERGIALHPLPASLWVRGAWAWSRGEDPRPWWTQALELDPEGAHQAEVPLSPEGQRALAAHAEELGAAVAAAGAWSRVAAADPGDGQAWGKACALLDAAGHPEEARQLAEAWLNAVDAGGPGTPRWEVACELARLSAAAGKLEAAQAALQDAVEVDFLRPEAWARALACPSVPLDAQTRGWWCHIHQLLVGDSAPPGAPLPPQGLLSSEALDAFHPGPMGWLDRIRAQLEPLHPPDRAELIRGLQRLDPARHPRAHHAIARAAAALGLKPPDTYLFHGEGACGASAWATTPPVLLLGATHLEAGPRHLSDAALTALVAVELTHLRCDHPLLLTQTELLGRISDPASGRYARAAESVVDLISLVPGVDQVSRLQRLLLTARRVLAARSALDRAGELTGPLRALFGTTEPSTSGTVGREGLAGAALALRIQADRAALAITGDLHATVEMILRASSRSLSHAERIGADGLAALLQAETLPADEALRLSALVQHAAGRSPTR